MIQRLIANWKTTSAGIVMILGSIIHLVFSISNHSANENTWTIAMSTMVAGIGLVFAGDASASDKAVNDVSTRVESVEEKTNILK